MTDPKVTVYTPDSSLASPIVMIREMFRDILFGRELAWRLAVRDLNAQYRQTLLGFFWMLVTPLATTLIWIFLSGSGVVKFGETSIPYPVYVFTGTMLWSIFMDALNAPLQMTTASKSMLAKINFPREALILAGIYRSLLNGSVKVALLLVVVVIFGIPINGTIALFPLGVLSFILVGTAFGLLVTPIGMLYTDIGRAIPMLMQLVMYVTPVVFPMPQEGWAKIVFLINPLTPIVLTTRDWLTGSPADYFAYFLIVNVFAACLLLVVWIAYRLAMPILIERMSS